jgi:hypothetical protein
VFVPGNDCISNLVQTFLKKYKRCIGNSRMLIVREAAKRIGLIVPRKWDLSILPSAIEEVSFGIQRQLLWIQDEDEEVNYFDFLEWLWGRDKNDRRGGRADGRQV